MHVIDASALAKSFLNESMSAEFRAWLTEAIVAGADVRAPPLAVAEIGRTIQKTHPSVSTAQAKELHASVFMGIRIHDTDPGGLAAWDYAGGLSYYDAKYVQMAASLEATLVTADSRQRDAAAGRRVSVLSFVPGEAGDEGRRP